MAVIEFVARSQPVPKGSKKAFVNPSSGRAIVVDDNSRDLRSWERLIRDRAQDAVTDAGGPLVGPIAVTLQFRLRRPQSMTPGPKSKRQAPCWPTTIPDVDKLARAVLDGLIAVAFKDDAQVASLRAEKRYTTTGEMPGVYVSLEPLEHPAGYEPLPAIASF